MKNYWAKDIGVYTRDWDYWSDSYSFVGFIRKNGNTWYACARGFEAVYKTKKEAMAVVEALEAMQVP